MLVLLCINSSFPPYTVVKTQAQVGVIEQSVIAVWFCSKNESYVFFSVAASVCCAFLFQPQIMNKDSSHSDPKRRFPNRLLSLCNKNKALTKASALLLKSGLFSPLFVLYLFSTVVKLTLRHFYYFGLNTGVKLIEICPKSLEL